MKRAGYTMIEMMLALAIGATLALVSAMLFKAGLKTYQYTYRQNQALKSGSAAMKGDGKLPGILTSAREAGSVSSLTSSSVIFVSTDGVTTTAYSVSTGTLKLVTGTKTYTLASDVSALTMKYYNINSSGLIQVSTQASLATFVTADVTVKGLTSTQKTYEFYSGAALRNHQ